jgi:3-methyl-2-oxobutanoate hydroxymethyltransferase
MKRVPNLGDALGTDTQTLKPHSMHPAGPELRKFVAPEVVFGVGALRLAGQYGRNLGGSKALVVADMPFLACRVSIEQTVQNAAKLFRGGGAAAVKLEAGRLVEETIRRLSEAGLPVMTHIGLTPQHVHRLGGMRQQGRTDEAAWQLLCDALALQEADAFALVLESVPDAVADEVNSSLEIPTIGIGGGPRCDGQVLVSYDMLGLFDGFVRPFVKQCVQLGKQIVNAAETYAEEVGQGVFPNSSYLSAPRCTATELTQS